MHCWSWPCQQLLDFTFIACSDKSDCILRNKHTSMQEVHLISVVQHDKQHPILEYSCIAICPKGHNEQQNTWIKPQSHRNANCCVEDARLQADTRNLY